MEFLKEEFSRCYLRYAILHGGKEDVTSPNNITLHSSAAIAELVPALDFRAKTKAERERQISDKNLLLSLCRHEPFRFHGYGYLN